MSMIAPAIVPVHVPDERGLLPAAALAPALPADSTSPMVLHHFAEGYIAAAYSPGWLTRDEAVDYLRIALRSDFRDVTPEWIVALS